jgi:hypothetical protein
VLYVILVSEEETVAKARLCLVELLVKQFRIFDCVCPAKSASRVMVALRNRLTA